MTREYNDSSMDELIIDVVDKLNKEIVLVAPLGLGKPVKFLNAIYNYAKTRNDINLTILTALSLSTPALKNNFAKKFLNPIVQRLYEGCINLDYELDRKKGRIPDNIKIIEFYLAPGQYLNNSQVQQDYICSNYTHVVRDISKYNINLIAHLIAVDENDSENISFSSNTDLTTDLICLLKKESRIFYLLGECNSNLPYMFGKDALYSTQEFDYIIRNKNDYKLFQIPRPAISKEDFMVGLYASTLVKDDGCLQIGIGSLSEALVHNIICRQNQNNKYKEFISDIDYCSRYDSLYKKFGSFDPMKKGLCALTEMMVDGYKDLYQNKILSKQVYDDVVLQKLINQDIISDEIPNNILDLLLEYKRISLQLTGEDVIFLQYYGIFNSAIVFDDGMLKVESSIKISTDLSDLNNKSNIIKYCLGKKLKNGRVAHCGFFLGSRDLYEFLHQLDTDEKKRFDMRSVNEINQLYGNEHINKLQRVNARFINSCMKVTLLGAAISDTLSNSQVVSGVGGQYNFVAMSHEIEGARSILCCRSTYNKNGKIFSNIVWEQGNPTIPRHLRDIVITEYGIADLRSKTDEEVIKELLNITDSRFQNELMKLAKNNNKLNRNYTIPNQYQNNHQEYIDRIVQKTSLYERYPFYSQLTENEKLIEEILSYIKSVSAFEKIKLVYRGMFIKKIKFEPILERLELYRKKNLMSIALSCLISAAYVKLGIGCKVKCEVH